MNRTAALELPMTLIVVIIISIVIFGLGIILAKEIYFEAEQSVFRISEQTRNQIFDMLDQGQPVVNPFPRKEVQRGDMAGFPIGIRNLLEDPENTFTIEVSPSAINDQLDTETQAWVSLARDEVKIRNGERDVVLLGIKVPKNAPRGTYAFIINIIEGGSDYVDPERVTVIVK